MADIFLSDNEKDRDTVRRLAGTLTSVGWSPWWDRRMVRSQCVCEEATGGRLKGCLIPVRIEDVKPRAGFREIQAADLIGRDGTTTFVGMRTPIPLDRRVEFAVIECGKA